MKTQIQKIVESIMENQDKSLLSEGGSKKFLDVKKQLKELGIHIHPSEGGEYRVVPQSDRKHPSKGYYTDDLDDALGTGKVMALKEESNRDRRSLSTKEYENFTPEDHRWESRPATKDDAGGMYASDRAWHLKQARIKEAQINRKNKKKD